MKRKPKREKLFKNKGIELRSKTPNTWFDVYAERSLLEKLKNESKRVADLLKKSSPKEKMLNVGYYGFDIGKVKDLVGKEYYNFDLKKTGDAKVMDMSLLYPMEDIKHDKLLRHGIGKNSFELLKSYAKSKGIKYIVAYTGKADTMRFFERMGFKPTGSGSFKLKLE